MESNYPENLYEYYRSNPSLFEEKTDSTKKIINYALAAICLLLIIFPSIIPIGTWLVRIIAGVGLLYFAFSAFTGSEWYSKTSGGKITEVAIKKFATPERGTEPGGADDQKVMQMFENNDWAGLAAEPEADNRPLQLYIHEDKTGRIFYLQLRRYFSSSDFLGVTDVKVLDEPQYSKFYQIIKSIGDT